jgi:hypothetical protein
VHNTSEQHAIVYVVAATQSAQATEVSKIGGDLEASFQILCQERLRKSNDNLIRFVVVADISISSNLEEGIR